MGTKGEVNDDANTFVAWNWKGGTTTGITTDGSTTITPSAYSFNATAGISIVKYTGNLTSGAKIAHGLGVAPTVVICKRLAGGTGEWDSIWNVSGLSNTNYLRLILQQHQELELGHLMILSLMQLILQLEILQKQILQMDVLLIVLHKKGVLQESEVT